LHVSSEFGCRVMWRDLVCLSPCPCNALHFDSVELCACVCVCVYVYVCVCLCVILFCVCLFTRLCVFVLSDSFGREWRESLFSPTFTFSLLLSPSLLPSFSPYSCLLSILPSVRLSF